VPQWQKEKDEWCRFGGFQVIVFKCWDQPVRRQYYQVYILYLEYTRHGALLVVHTQPWT
jgi:hypothetical protein